VPDDYPNEVTTVIRRKITPNREKDYDNWFRRYLTVERKAHGYLGTDPTFHSRVRNQPFVQPIMMKMDLHMIIRLAL